MCWVDAKRLGRIIPFPIKTSPVKDLYSVFNNSKLRNWNAELLISGNKTVGFSPSSIDTTNLGRASVNQWK